MASRGRLAIGPGCESSQPWGPDFSSARVVNKIGFELFNDFGWQPSSTCKSADCRTGRCGDSRVEFVL
jgi:hypothetical protein